MRILYGVVGEGMGHATRSRVVLDELVREHEVRVVASGRAYEYLVDHIPDVQGIWGLTFALEQGDVHMLQTVLQNLRGAVSGWPQDIRAYYRLAEQFKPDVVVSDFESFSVLYAQRHRLPIVSVDNIQILDRCRHEPALVRGYRGELAVARRFVSMKVPRAFHYLIATFFEPPVRKPRTTLVPPLLRPEILAARSEPGDHLLVYSAGGDAVRDALKAAGVPCRIYGMHPGGSQEVVDGPLTYRPFGEQRFVEDLRTARGLVTGGGFTLLSEAVYLRKPILSIPLAGQAEQQLNARYVDSLGYGLCAPSLSAEVLTRFLDGLPQFAERLATYEQDGNAVALGALGDQLEAAAARPRRLARGRSDG